MLNTDGVVKTIPGQGGLEGIIRNHKGERISGFVATTPHATPYTLKSKPFFKDLDSQTP